MNQEKIYISHGAKHKMFTLRHFFLEPVYRLNEATGQYYVEGHKERDHYICRLSNDEATAIEKAKAWHKENAPKLRLDTRIDFDLLAITKSEIDHSIITWGKYSGKSIYPVARINAPYLAWSVLNVSTVRSEKTMATIREIPGMAAEIKKIEDKKARREQRKIDRRQAIIDRAAKSEFQGEIGDRVELSLTVVFDKTIETEWGNSRLIIFEDNDDNVYKTFGTGAALWGMENGDKVVIKATIKGHDTNRRVLEWSNNPDIEDPTAVTKQTVLTRVKEMEVVECPTCGKEFYSKKDAKRCCKK